MITATSKAGSAPSAELVQYMTGNAERIKKAKEAMAVIQSAEQEVQEKWGPTVFTPQGLRNPQSRARLLEKNSISAEKAFCLLAAVREAIANPEAAQAVMDHLLDRLLFSPGARVVLSSLQGASSPLLAQYQVKFDESRELISGSFTAFKKTTDKAIGEAINRESQRLYKRNAIDPWLLENCESAEVNQGETSTVSIARDPYYNTRSSNKKSRRQQYYFLAGRNEHFASALKTAIIAGFYRLEEGFPESGVGTSSDKRGFFGGNWARTVLDKSGVGVVGSYADGVVCGGHYVDGLPEDCVFAAGAPIFKTSART